MLPDIRPGNTKILYFFNCLLDGMHTKIRHICDFSRCGLNVRLQRSHPNLAPRPQICFIYLQEFCSLAAQKISWRDLGKKTGDVEASNLSQNKSCICMGSQQTASKESRYPIFVASEQRSDASG